MTLDTPGSVSGMEHRHAAQSTPTDWRYDCNGIKGPFRTECECIEAVLADVCGPPRAVKTGYFPAGLSLTAVP